MLKKRLYETKIGRYFFENRQYYLFIIQLILLFSFFSVALVQYLEISHLRLTLQKQTNNVESLKKINKELLELTEQDRPSYLNK